MYKACELSDVERLWYNRGQHNFIIIRSRNWLFVSFTIVTVAALQDRRREGRVLLLTQIKVLFSFNAKDWLWGERCPIIQGGPGTLPWGKAQGAWRYSLCRRPQRRAVIQYVHSNTAAQSGLWTSLVTFLTTNITMHNSTQVANSSHELFFDPQKMLNNCHVMRRG